MPGAVNLTFFGSAIKKLGFELEVARVGKFKSFMEPYIMDAPSKASRGISVTRSVVEWRVNEKSSLKHGRSASYELDQKILS